MPSVSIVIPTYRRQAILARVLDRLEDQDGDFEVLVVDEPDGDDSAAVATAIDERPYPVRQLHAGAGATSKRNTGWRAASAPLVLFLDDDVLPEPGFVAAHLRAHAEEPAEEVGVLGRLEWAREVRVTPFMRFLEEGVQFDFGGIEDDEDAGWGRFYTANVSVKRPLLDRVGGFDESFPIDYEDLDIARRMHDLGFRLRYCRAASAEHLSAPTLEGYKARMARVALGERRMIEKHPDFPPYFHWMFSEAIKNPARGRGRALARVVSPTFPALGPYVWNSVRAYYRYELAAAFLAAWDSGSGPK